MPRHRRHKKGGRGYKDRYVDTREVKQRFLIVCEGEQTEPNYFRAFRVPREVVVKVLGQGEDPLSLVETAQTERHKDEYDQVWVVFDRDDVPADRFNRALALAEQLGIEVAYSNRAFESWYVLHFEYAHTARVRRDYVTRLTTLLGAAYMKNSDEMYVQLLARQPEALRHAERLLVQYAPRNPAEDDPSTTVHRLVQQLNRFL